ncbi:MAG TPA: biopolymer transporter ExbD [Porphyromonadaceae bacterium]|jgi:biopolymer transport protein ExbD|uniref:ExbD/TolR family protein n=1 Tax=Limibacterium fermenti TaxID=3229863 RepID=UPI000E8F6581|nr:biopolymer transporter ExbD [Porphyromonadaceae bacterium]HBL33564.1 biopolymer transporter ExbD [Porphyromonadaceae bacterium]HBX20099.1 biopolymer transporter ExbD [Porphyromonadaceae bacterium]HBX45709.1 biopolymer transporter ExbD [Porphyromonadaceae bacterium]HCM20368.1 biopolymer transporter ExbD [Porphyromonadaceae bacterium]
MADIQPTGGGKKKKGEMKKADTRVNFTPLVDMIMLLLTFFMLATTLSKPQTMEISMPTKDKVDVEEQNEVKASEAMTIYLGPEHKVYYYEGLANLEEPNFLTETDFSAEGIRSVLTEKNRTIVQQVRELKNRKTLLQVSQEDYDRQLSELRNSKGSPVVIIKPLDSSTYSDMIAALDEMQITSIGKYAITELDDNDRTMLSNSNFPTD